MRPTVDSETVGAALGTNLLASSGHGNRDVMLEAFVAARRDRSLAEVVSRSLEAEADALAAMVSEGKESGSIDPSLSTDVIVLLCQALGLGTQLAISEGSRDRPAPTADVERPAHADHRSYGYVAPR